MKHREYTIPISLVLTAYAVWMSALSINAFNDHATLASVSSSIADVKTNVDMLARESSLQTLSADTTNKLIDPK